MVLTINNYFFPNNINRSVYVADTKSVSYEVRTEFLYIIVLLWQYSQLQHTFLK
jgi:hypothetical protein